MSKRGQAAMEFLMTYGWAIVVVLAAIGALAYFGVLSPDNLLPDNTKFAAPLMGTEAVITASDESINIPLTNNKGSRVEINSVDADADCGGAASVEISVEGGAFAALANQSINNGQPFNLKIVCTDDLVQGDRFSSTVSIVYTDPEKFLQHTHTGKVQGKVE